MARDARLWVSCFHSVRDLPSAGQQCQRPWRGVTRAAAAGAARWGGWKKVFFLKAEFYCAGPGSCWGP